MQRPNTTALLLHFFILWVRNSDRALLSDLSASCDQLRSSIGIQLVAGPICKVQNYFTHMPGKLEKQFVKLVQCSFPCLHVVLGFLSIVLMAQGFQRQKLGLGTGINHSIGQISHKPVSRGEKETSSFNGRNLKELVAIFLLPQCKCQTSPRNSDLLSVWQSPRSDFQKTHFILWCKGSIQLTLRNTTL